MWFYLHFHWRLASRASQLIRPPADWSTAVTSHAAVNSDARSIQILFRSLLKIFEYAAKQACKQLQCNKAKLSEPASVNGLHIHRVMVILQIVCFVIPCGHNVGIPEIRGGALATHHLGWGAWLVHLKYTLLPPNSVLLRQTVSPYVGGPKTGEHWAPSPNDGAWLTS